MTATKAHETTSNRRLEVSNNIEERTETYVNEVLHRQVCYVAMLGHEKLVHLLPVGVNKGIVINLLEASDDYIVKSVGRLLIIRW